MNKNIENEKRLMLTPEQYLRLMDEFSSYPDSIFIEQINYYFDDEDLSLRNNHMVLRIRVINDNEFELTLKIKGKLNNGDTEINIPLTKEKAENLIKNPIFNEKEIIEEVSKVTSKPIKLITSLKTERLEHPYEDHLVVIDKNYYSDVIDFDLEIEAKSVVDATNYIFFYARKYNLKYERNYASKSRRAINKALGIN